MEKKLKIRNYHIYAFITVVLWASSFAFTKVALEAFTVPALSLYRFLFAGIFLLLISIIKKIGLPSVKDIPIFILSGAMGFSVYMITFNKGIDALTSATACIVIATAPIITAILAYVVFHEKIKTLGWIAIGIEFVGILVLTLWDGVFAINSGIFWMIISAFLLSGYNLLQRKLTKRYTAFQTTAYSIFAGALMLMVFLPVALPQAAGASWQHWGAVAYMGIFPSAIAYLLWGKALSLADKTSEVVNFMFIQPLIAMLLGVLIVFEIPTLSMYIGGGIIVFGLFMFSAKK